MSPLSLSLSMGKSLKQGQTRERDRPVTCTRELMPAHQLPADWKKQLQSVSQRTCSICSSFCIIYQLHGYISFRSQIFITASLVLNRILVVQFYSTTGNTVNTSKQVSERLGPCSALAFFRLAQIPPIYCLFYDVHLSSMQDDFVSQDLRLQIWTSTCWIPFAKALG